ncbi:MAG: type II toxin-antitoxin system VapC family toxin [Nanoarchaeota archaeon]
MIGIDTSVIIDILRKHTDWEKVRQSSDEDFWTSELVVYELFYGAYASKELTEKKIKDIEALLDVFTFIAPFQRKAAIEAARIGGTLSKEGQMIDHIDLLIAGSLLANGCTTFLTKNKRDFERIKELHVVSL